MLSRLRNNAAFRKVLSNAGWMMSEQIVRLAITLFVSVGMARYLGPGNFGRLTAAVAYSGIFGILAKLGLDRITARELVENAAYPERLKSIVSTLWTLRVIAAFATYAICLAVAYCSGWGDTLIVSIVAASVVFSATDSIDILFQARMESRTIVVARSLAFFATSAVKIILLLVHAPFISFVWASLLDFAAASFGLIKAYGLRHAIPLRINLDLSLAGRLLKESWPEILAGFSGLLFIRLDQVMLNNMIGSKAAGIFAVASRLSEIWYFVPMALISSTFPSIVLGRVENPELYLKRIQKLMTALVALSYSVIVLVQIFAHPVITLLYGSAYAESAQVLVIHIWSSLFMSLGLASGSWIMAERRVKLNLYRNLAGAACNIALNLLLIPRFGAIGAAYATLASLAIAYFVSDFFIYPMRQMARLKMQALILRV